MQNFVVIVKVQSKPYHCKFWWNFEFDRNIVSGTGDRPMFLDIVTGPQWVNLLSPSSTKGQANNQALVEFYNESVPQPVNWEISVTHLRCLKLLSSKELIKQHYHTVHCWCLARCTTWLVPWCLNLKCVHQYALSLPGHRGLLMLTRVIEMIVKPLSNCHSCTPAYCL